MLKFERIQSNLYLTVDGILKQRKVKPMRIDVSKFVTAPLRFGGNPTNPNIQNLQAKLSNIKLVRDAASIPLLQLNEEQIHFLPIATDNISPTELILTNDFVADIAPCTIGNFGSSSDWSIEFEFSANGIERIYPDKYGIGALFIRSGEEGPPFTGPTAFLRSDGGILFRMTGDDTDWWAGALPEPLTYPASRKLKFEMENGRRLIFSVDGIEQRTKIIPTQFDESKFVNAHLRFGGNHKVPNNQNIEAQLSNIKLVGDTS